MLNKFKLMNQFWFWTCQKLFNPNSKAYDALVGADVPELILTTYFGDVRPNLKAIENLPVAGFHFDFVRVPEQLDEVASILKDGQTLSAGVVDGRNIWKTDFAKASAVVQKLLKSW